MVAARPCLILVWEIIVVARPCLIMVVACAWLLVEVSGVEVVQVLGVSLICEVGLLLVLLDLGFGLLDAAEHGVLERRRDDLELVHDPAGRGAAIAIGPLPLLPL